MIIALRSLAVFLFAVSLLCGTAAMAHGGGADGGMAHGAASDHHAVGPDCNDCAVDADMSCAAMLGHCGPAIAGAAGIGAVARSAMARDRDLPADLSLTGAGPDFDTPPPRG